MKKKQEEYMPQFDLDNVEENRETESGKCIKCGKYSAFLHDGYCFECRQQEEELQSKATKEYFEKQDKKKSVLCVTIILVVCIVIFLLSVLILADIIPASEILKKACYKGLIGAISGGFFGVIGLLVEREKSRK